MNVLSLCDGMSCGHIALDRAGISVDEYYAAEIKPIAIRVTMANYPETHQLGNIKDIHYSDGVLYAKGVDYPTNIDLLIFGLPCQSFSKAMKKSMRIGLADKERSGLFFECLRILREVKPTYFLMENVTGMADVDRLIISKSLGVRPIRINSKLVSPALRDRYYWSNIPNLTAPEDKNIFLQDILTSGYTDRKKARALRAADGRPLKDKHKMLRRYKTTGFTTLVWEERGNDDTIRYLNQLELERCQTVPEGYTRCLSRNEAANVLGDGWTIDVIAHLFKGLLDSTVKQL